MHGRLIYANPTLAGVCQGVQEDLAPEQTMRHSLIGVKNLQKVTNSREVRSYRQCHEEFPALQSPQSASLCTLWYFALGQFLLAIAVHWPLGSHLHLENLFFFSWEKSSD